MSGPKGTMQDTAAVARFFNGLELLEPGVLGPDQVTAWRGVARKR